MAEDLLGRVAAVLGLQMKGRPAGGEFGAAFVSDSSGEALILKAVAGIESEPAWRRGAELATAMRVIGYPAPSFVGIGTADGVTWSLQSILPGELPDIMTADHARNLVALAERHKGQSPTPDQFWGDELTERSLIGARLLGDLPGTAAWGRELHDALRQLARQRVRCVDVVHNDFHHRNFLAAGTQVSGVFDWESAVTGDWRFDLTSLAFWTCLDSDHVTGEAREVAIEAARAACPPELLAFFAAAVAVRVVGFYAAVRPSTLPPKLRLIDAKVAQWWR